jgi:5'-phosphate synthase pdxT subunit
VSERTSALSIGVLALQGGFREHLNRLRTLGVRAEPVRTAAQLKNVDGLILPGGESTTIGLIAERWQLVVPLRDWVQAGKPIWGTCAGMILLADRAVGQKEDGQPLIGGLDVLVNRNYFGSQKDSFETWLQVKGWAEAAHAIFIRAPAILELGTGVTSLAVLPAEQGPEVAVAVQQAQVLGTAFHPELTADLRWHELFLKIVEQSAI